MRMAERLGRWIRHSATGQWLAARIGAGYIGLVIRTTRWTVEGAEHRDAVLARDGGIIVPVWHGRLFLSVAFTPPGRQVVAMISNNRDGDLITAVVARFGTKAVRGSTYDHAKARDKGGIAAYQGAVGELKDGAVVAITPDGPRGPRMRAQPGVAALAIATGCPVIPISFSARRGKVFRSWDRFFVPWPFGRGVMIYGPVIDPPADRDDATVEALRREIESATNAITLRADELCGRTPVAPDPG